jgi:hypothetical protein
MLLLSARHWAAKKKRPKSEHLHLSSILKNKTFPKTLDKQMALQYYIEVVSKATKYPHLIQGLKIMTAIYCQEIQDLATQAGNDFDRFWTSLSESDRKASGSLCSSESYDAIVKMPDGWYSFACNENRRDCEVLFLGSLAVFVSTENTGLPKESLEEFRNNLASLLPGIEVVCEDKMPCEWLAGNRQLEDAWAEALEACK